MAFVIEQECPQCAAPLELSETDRILTCPYCDVQSCLFTPDYFRYTLPHKTVRDDIIHVPYLRFRGTVFFCDQESIGHRIVDITQTGIPLRGVPASLGFRPQAMKARFATDKTSGKFFKFTLKAADILMRAAKLSSSSNSGEIIHRAFIGETMSIMYLPVYIEDGGIYDAVLDRPIAELSGTMDDIEKLILKKAPETVSFIPTLCPKCGWTMQGEKDSVALVCRNCDTAWEAGDKKFNNIKTLISSKKADKDNVYLPFWKITARTKGIEINSFADFINATGQPLFVRDEHNSMKMNYWSPAFKIRPKMFLQLSKQFTIMQKNDFETPNPFPSQKLHPVTLPPGEAVQSLKIILASSTIMKKNVIPFLPKIGFKVEEKTLVYIPFRETGYDLINDDLGVSVNRQSLEFGRKL